MTTTQYLKPETVRGVVFNLGGKVFTVVFHKADGTERVLNGRRGVRKHLRGGESTISERPHLVGVYDYGARDYRCFDDRRVLELRAGGEVVRP